MIVRLIQRMEQDGTLKRLMKAGFISTKVLAQKKIYERYEEKRLKGVPSTEAAVDTAIEFKCSDVSVWRAIANMKKP